MICDFDIVVEIQLVIKTVPPQQRKVKPVTEVVGSLPKPATPAADVVSTADTTPVTSSSSTAVSAELTAAGGGRVTVQAPPHAIQMIQQAAIKAQGVHKVKVPPKVYPATSGTATVVQPGATYQPRITIQQITPRDSGQHSLSPIKIQQQVPSAATQGKSQLPRIQRVPVWQRPSYAMMVVDGVCVHI